MKLAKNWVLDYFSKIQVGQIFLQEGDEHYTFGNKGELHANINIVNPQFYSKSLSHGSLGAAQSFIDGDWQTNDLTTLLRIIIQNEHLMQKIDNPISKLQRFALDIVAKIKKNTPSRSREHIHAHYDLGNTFFQTFLDETLLYSCAIFASPDESLYDAQMRKMERICELLAPKPTDHILEIGTGWGSLAIYLAQTYACHVTTTTISTEQFNYVNERIHTLNLQDKITLLNQDYRDLQGQFEKIVSIEMIEAVGHQYFDTFFGKCDQLLKPGGLLMIQAITMNEQTYDNAKEHIDFIKKYVFPGSCLPSIFRMGKSIAEQTDLQWLSLNDIGRNYATTLHHWHDRFMNNLDAVRAQNFSEEFIRLWQYYLCYCEAGFIEDYISDVQLLWRKRGNVKMRYNITANATDKTVSAAVNI